MKLKDIIKNEEMFIVKINSATTDETKRFFIQKINIKDITSMDMDDGEVEEILYNCINQSGKNDLSRVSTQYLYTKEQAESLASEWFKKYMNMEFK